MYDMKNFAINACICSACEQTLTIKAAQTEGTISKGKSISNNGITLQSQTGKVTSSLAGKNN